MQTQTPLTQDLVLIGGGHAHALVLRMFGMKPVPGLRLTLIDPRPVTTYTGMLPGHVAGHYTADEIGIDLVRLARFAGARIILGAASSVDTDGRRINVETAEGPREIAYDVASLDIGITSDLPKVSGFAEHGHPVKPFPQFARGWARYLAQEEKTDIAVIGAGLGGTEIALAMRHRVGAGVPVRLIGSGGLSGAGAALAARLQTELDRAGIELIEGRVVEVTATEAVLETGERVPAGFCVGAAGATPQRWVTETGLPTEDGFVQVTDTLQVIGQDRLFAAGDCAALTHAPRPKAGVFAVRAAKVLADNLRAMVTGGGLRPFRPQRHYLRLVSLGGPRAVAEKYPALPLAPAGGAIWRWKDRIDRRFMQRLTDLPQMRPAPPPKGAALGAAEIVQAAPLCAGCGSKVGAGVLDEVLARMTQPERADVLTGPGDDAGILRIGGQMQVLTTDHLRAFTEDPGLMARIAAQHALGDIRAMGGVAQSALAQIILPRASEPVQARMMAEIMSAAGDVFGRAGAVILGGHSTMGAELTIGFSITGLCDGLCDGAPITLGGAQAGDALILTAPIGSGVLLAAEMQGKARGADVAALWSAMAAGQAEAAEVLRGAHAMTDVTGFGLAGHLLAMCRASGVAAELWGEAVPVHAGALDLARRGVRSTLFEANRSHAPVFGAESPLHDLLHDPQTAGGLLASVPETDCAAVLARLEARGVRGVRIGALLAGPPSITLI